MSESGKARWRCVALLAALLAGCATVSPDGADRATARTWRQADVLLPAALTHSGRAEWHPLADSDAAVRGGAAPAPLYLDITSCTGRLSAYAGMALASGFAVIAPATFARGPLRIATCEDVTGNDTVRWRVREIAYAMASFGTLPWVDRDRVVLGGHGEGGRAVARYRGQAALAGRLASGIGCAEAAVLLGLERAQARRRLAAVRGPGDCPGVHGQHLLVADPDGPTEVRERLREAVRALLADIAAESS